MSTRDMRPTNMEAGSANAGKHKTEASPAGTTQLHTYEVESARTMPSERVYSALPLAPDASRSIAASGASGAIHPLGSAPC